MPATRPIEAPLIEVFSSLQGEGVLIGCRQVFLRLAECNLSCDYCDTPFVAQSDYRFEQVPGSGVFHQAPNPADLKQVEALLQGWKSESPDLHHSLALTGGEPLLHAEVLRQWLPEIKQSWPVFLETNGTLPEALRSLLPMIDWISMDIKGSAVSGVETPWDTHADFMALGAEKLCQVKLVVDSTTTATEVSQAASLVSQHAPECPLILQPRTLKNGLALDGKSLLDLQGIATKTHYDVRIIPQIHPWLGVA